MAYDTQAIPIIKRARELEISIPGELALIGNHNTPWAEFYGLTSIDNQVQLIVEEIKSVLGSDTNVKIMIKPKLIFRQSCPKIKDIAVNFPKPFIAEKTACFAKTSMETVMLE